MERERERVRERVKSEGEGGREAKESLIEIEREIQSKMDRETYTE